MLIMLTSRCHMGCRHCMQDAQPDGRLMTEETFESIMGFCQEAQPMVLTITGGEPSEHPQWIRWTRRLMSLKSVAVVTIVTNGTWIEDTKQRTGLARLIRESKGKLKVQVYSNPLYYPDHEWTVEHEQQFRSNGCIADFNSPLFMQDLGRARQNCHEEVEESKHVPSCINSHLIAVQSLSLTHFLQKCIGAGKFCRPLIDLDGNIHMSESWLCPAVANVSDGITRAFLKMKQSRPCKACRLYKNFEELHPVERLLLEIL